ncbi:MAG TPA: TIGR03032 family protein [Gemmataceae bacterium]|nr:TIGR03032 family protein [Gemmataceae bacterium]
MAEIHPPVPAMTAVRFEHSVDFPGILADLGVSVLISTYQAGRVLVIGTDQGRLHISFHAFDQPMGMAASPRQLAVVGRRQVWILKADKTLAPRLDPPGRHDGAYFVRSSVYTGTIAGHEAAWCGNELWVVNTLFSCLATLSPDFHFVPRWRPPFITGLAAEDRCHLNGMAVADGRPRYVSALARTDAPQGWRPDKARTGCLIEVPGGEVVAAGLCMPHSPRVHDGRLWICNSGHGNLDLVDRQTGTLHTVARVPGYTRGLAFHGPFAFVGLSRIRETNVFGGLPIADRRAELLCGLGVIDLRSGQTVATFVQHSGVEEIFDVQVVPVRCLALSGPDPEADQTPVVWSVPPEVPPTG